MKKVITTEKLPIKLWLDNIEEGALEQAKNLANLPFAYKWISIMPDSHQGYGMPIGGVLATQRVIIPNAVGVDIGCGMCVVKSDIKDFSKDDVKRIFGGLRQCVPVGFKWHDKSQRVDIEAEHTDIITPLLEKSQKQIGTLGGGNHFIEIQQDIEGYLYIMIHSGSRNLGYTVAAHYNKTAIELNRRWESTVPAKWELAFLPLETKAATDYIEDMNYCIEFALQNRLLMMKRAIESVQEIFPESEFGEIKNEPHNFARFENHHGNNVIVHRKGATSSREGETGMIPGSQGTSSYIVEGKGNTDSFESCSHGSGRLMSRTQARKELVVLKETNMLDVLGVVHSIRNKKDLDEAPSAYKDIREVMANQEDLVDIITELYPRGVIKG